MNITVKPSFNKTLLNSVLVGSVNSIMGPTIFQQNTGMRVPNAHLVGIMTNCVRVVDNMAALTLDASLKGEIDKIQTLNTKMIIDQILEDVE